jgi:iron(III) transport system substrate-binding protein
VFGIEDNQEEFVKTNRGGLQMYITLITVLMATLLLFQPGTAQAQAVDPGLVEGAKKEGEVVWYTSMSISESQPIVDRFEKKYPFVKTNLLRASSEKVLQRILTETQAGRWDFDTVALSEVGILRERNLIAPYVSPQAKAFPAEFKDPKGYWTAVYNNYFVIGYNTQKVTAAQAPKDWQDFLDPKWKSKLAMDQEEYEWYAGLQEAWGKERTQKYMSALAKQDIQWRKGHTLIAQLMSAGEFHIAIVYAHRIEQMKKEGAPVEWVNTSNPIVVATNGMAISAKPKHPNAAKLFTDFILSKEAQEVIRSFNRIPARSDVDPLSPKMDQSKIKVKVVPENLPSRYGEVVKEFKSVFSLN